VTFTLPLPKKVDADLAADVEKQAPYASPHVRRLRVSADLAHVEVELEDGANTDEVRGKVERYLGTMVSKYRALDRKELYLHARKDRAPYASSAAARWRSPAPRSPATARSTRCASRSVTRRSARSTRSTPR
jgi:hypothetical protein